MREFAPSACAGERLTRPERFTDACLLLSRRGISSPLQPLLFFLQQAVDFLNQFDQLVVILFSCCQFAQLPPTLLVLSHHRGAPHTSRLLVTTGLYHARYNFHGSASYMGRRTEAEHFRVGLFLRSSGAREGERARLSVPLPVLLVTVRIFQLQGKCCRYRRSCQGL